MKPPNISTLDKDSSPVLVSHAAVESKEGRRDEGSENNEPPTEVNKTKLPAPLGHRRQASKGLGIITTSLEQDERPIKSLGCTLAPDLAAAAPLKGSCPQVKIEPPHSTPSSCLKDLASISQVERVSLASLGNHDPARSATPDQVSMQGENKTYTGPRSGNNGGSASTVQRARSYRSSRSYSDDDDEIMPLPSPFPSGDHRSPSLDHYYYVFPEDRVASPTSPVTPDEDVTPLPSTSIPVIAASPLFKKMPDRIPTLADHPMLGDMDDADHGPLEPPTIPMVREHCKLLQQHADEDLTGKQIDQFRIRNLLGVGAFSKVYLAEHQENRRKYAIKAINKGSLINNPRVRSSVKREVGVLKFIDHPNIVRFESTMETAYVLCIVLEYAEGEELFDFVQKAHASKSMDEALMQKIFLQLVRVVEWIHAHNIVHRDLKLENVLIRMDKDHAPHLKVTDFGLARVIDPLAPMLTTRCGSEEYAAPEIVQAKGYDGRQTDTWALGVMLYAMLVGYLPFRFNPARGERVSQMFYRIVKADVHWPDTAISDEAKYVVKQILVRQPEKRIALKAIRSLPWCLCEH